MHLITPRYIPRIEVINYKNTGVYLLYLWCSAGRQWTVSGPVDVYAEKGKKKDRMQYWTLPVHLRQRQTAKKLQNCLINLIPYRLTRNLLNMEGAGSIPEFFDVLLHLGTLIAVFAAYWGDIRDMVVEFFRGIGDLAHRSTPTPVPPARRLILLIIVGTLPLFAVLPIRKAVQGLGDNMYFVGAALIFTGFLLFLCDRVRRAQDRAQRHLAGRSAGGRGAGGGHAARRLPFRHDHHRRVLRGL